MMNKKWFAEVCARGRHGSNRHAGTVVIDGVSVTQRIVSVSESGVMIPDDPFKTLRMLGASDRFPGVDIDRVHTHWNKNATR